MTKFKIFLFILLLLIIGAAWFVSAGSFSSGDRAGTISKLSKRGYVFKTYEGVLNEGGYSGETGTLTPRYWDFSVLASKDTVNKKLDEALRTGERVTIKYEEKFFQFPWNGDTKYFVTDIEFLGHHTGVQLTQPVPTATSTVPAPAPVITTVIDTLKK